MRYGIEPVEIRNRAGKVVAYNWYVVDLADRNRPRRLTQFAFGTADAAAAHADLCEESAARWAARKSA
ncbi:hypothetical protein [Kitasatospora sp. NPDC001132]